MLSVAGDQLARVAVTVLVYDRTRSPLLAAVAYAASIAPVFLGITLSGLADRWPRRDVMVVCDLARVPLAAAMAIPGMPVAGSIGLLCGVTALGAPFSAARAATYPDVLGDAYPVGAAVTMSTYQLAQVLGFAAGGAAVGLAGARVALLADSGTFLASALMIVFGVRRRPVPAVCRARQPAHRDLLAAVRTVFGDRDIRTPMLLGWLSWAYNVPEGLAAPLAHGNGGGPLAVAAILAAAALGSSAGALLLVRLAGPAARQRLMVPLACAACAVLIAAAFRPGLMVMLAVLLVAGVCDGGYQAQANAAFVAAVPGEQRAQAFGVASGGMLLGQGIVMVLAGAAAQRAGPWLVIAVTGGAGTLAALLIASD